MFGIFGFEPEEEKHKKEIDEKFSDSSHPPSLEDLLLLDGIVNELQDRNENLTNFFTKEKVKQMIDYIIKEPKNDDYNKGHKFPFVCSKLFNIEDKNIMKYFFMTNKEIEREENIFTKSKELKSKEINVNIINNDKYNNDNDDIDKYYKTGLGDNFEDDNYDEVNMDNIPEFNLNENEDKINNNKEIKNYNEDEEDNINYKDNKDDIINDKNDNKIKLYEKNENLEDDLVNTGFIEEEKEEERDNGYDEDEIVNIQNDKDNKGNNNNDNNINININNDDGYHEIITEKVLKEINEEKEDEDININNNIDININNEIKNNNYDKEDNIIIEENNDNNKNEINIINIINEEETKEKKEEKEENKIEIEEKKKIKEKNKDDENDHIELLDYFLSFVSTETELNYVLCGYFSSLMIILLNKDYIKILKYLFFQRKDILKKLVFHSYRKSIAETLCKIIKFEDKIKSEENDYDLNIKEFNEKEFKDIRLEILKEIFDNLDINMDTDKFSSISYLITNLSENKNIFQTILNSKDLINSLVYKNLSNLNLQKDTNDINYFNKKNNFITLCDIIIYWLNNINNIEIQIPMLLYEVNEDFDDDEDTVQQNEAKPEIHHSLLSQTLCDILPNLLKNNFNFNNDDNNDLFIIQSYNDEKIKPLGLYKIKLVELLSNIIVLFKNIPNEFDNIIIKSDFCTNAINYIFQYQYNNLYQEVVFQFFKNLFNKEEDSPMHELLFEHIFNELNLLEKIKTNFPNKDNEGNTGIGYAPFLVNLAYKINSVIGGNRINIDDKNYMKQGSITFMKRGKNQSINGIGLTIPFHLETLENNENYSNKKIISISGLDKYCNDEWKYFFSEKIENKVLLYEDLLYNKKNSTNEKDDLFLSPRNDNDKEETENLLGMGNLRYNNKNDIYLNYNNDDDNINDKINIANFKDMEININDFNFNDIIENDKDNKININDEDEKKLNKEFNNVNYWKNDVEENKNSYLNMLGEEAMKDLLE